MAPESEDFKNSLEQEAKRLVRAGEAFQYLSDHFGINIDDIDTAIIALQNALKDKDLAPNTLASITLLSQKLGALKHSVTINSRVKFGHD